MPEYSLCRSCGARMLWARTTAGNLMPLDAEPNDKGNVVLVDGVAHVLKGDLFEPMMSGPRYMPHHATCTHPDKWRKKGGDRS